MVYAVGAGSVFASQFHLFSHSIFKALLFLAAGAVIHNIGTRDMLAMGGVGKKMPFVQWVFAIGALALAGIPILNGFWSKELILENGLETRTVLDLCHHGRCGRVDRAVYSALFLAGFPR